VRLPWLAHNELEALGPYITIPQYRFNKTKQHTTSSPSAPLLISTSLPLPPLPLALLEARFVRIFLDFRSRGVVNFFYICCVILYNICGILRNIIIYQHFVLSYVVMCLTPHTYAHTDLNSAKFCQ